MVLEERIEDKVVSEISTFLIMLTDSFNYNVEKFFHRRQLTFVGFYLTLRINQSTMFLKQNTYTLY